MCLTASRTAPNRMLSAGMTALVIANVGSYVLRQKLAVPDSFTDPVSGFLYGVAIAAMLIGIRRRARTPWDDIR